MLMNFHGVVEQTVDLFHPSPGPGDRLPDALHVRRLHRTGEANQFVVRVHHYLELAYVPEEGLRVCLRPLRVQALLASLRWLPLRYPAGLEPIRGDHLHLLDHIALDPTVRRGRTVLVNRLWVQHRARTVTQKPHHPVVNAAQVLQCIRLIRKIAISLAQEL